MRHEGGGRGGRIEGELGERGEERRGSTKKGVVLPVERRQHREREGIGVARWSQRGGGSGKMTLAWPASCGPCRHGEDVGGNWKMGFTTM